MSEQWKPGDVVRLKSGGPKMTVIEQSQDQNGEPAVHCEWFDEDRKPQRHAFAPTSLQTPPAAGRVAFGSSRGLA
jgi:uncharacterized protein YodC (DUF2158 family)